jgi:hypothetical protein
MKNMTFQLVHPTTVLKYEFLYFISKSFKIIMLVTMLLTSSAEIQNI